MRFSLEFENDESFDGSGLLLPTASTWQGPRCAEKALEIESLIRLPWLAFAEELANHFEAVFGPESED
jgi:hypothetical protein